MLGPNAFIYFGLASGLVLVAFSLYWSRGLPLLAELFSLMLSVTAAYSGIELCYFVLEGSKKLGDFQDQKLIIVLGAVAVFWVALLTIINLVKGIVARGSLQEAPINLRAQENA